MTKQEIIIASNNQGKIHEIKTIYQSFPLNFRSLKDIWSEPPDIEETGLSFEENAQIKADWVFTRTKAWVLADDSGLEVDYLNGNPGIYSSRYAGEEKSDEKNMHKLLYELHGIPSSQRTARFRCALVLKRNNGDDYIINGVCEGTIGHNPRGNNGFGYDPLFIPKGYSCTFAEMDDGKKNRISHRGKALNKLKEELHELFAE